VLTYLSLQCLPNVSDNGQGDSQPSADADLHARQQMRGGVALDSPYTHPSRKCSPHHPISRPLANGMQAGQTNGASAVDAPSRSGSAGQEPSPNGEVSNIDRLIEP
jgi:hypothetical protein